MTVIQLFRENRNSMTALWGRYSAIALQCAQAAVYAGLYEKTGPASGGLSVLGDSVLNSKAHLRLDTGGPCSRLGDRATSQTASPPAPLKGSLERRSRCKRAQSSVF